MRPAHSKEHGQLASRTGLVVGAEEDRGVKDSFEGADRSAILCSALSNAEDIQHLGGGRESHSRRLLAVAGMASA